jgi:hypothetical protein
MADTDYLQHMFYTEGEFLLAQDFTLEESYFQNQFTTLFSYYFSPGLAGVPQTQIPDTLYRLYREPQVVATTQNSTQPVSFYLSLVSAGEPPVSQDANYISVGKGLAIDLLSRQITLLSGAVVDKSCFANITGDKAYLTVAYGESASVTDPKVIVQQPVFGAVMPPAAYNSVDSNALYLATVTLKDKAIVGIEIEPDLRLYSRPYAEIANRAQTQTRVRSGERETEIADLKAKLAQLEADMKSLASLKGHKNLHTGSSQENA